MGCNCDSGGAPVGRSLMTSGDYAAQQAEPLAVLGVDEPVPEGAAYRVTSGGQVAYFAGHTPAFEYQQAEGGKLRIV